MPRTQTSGKKIAVVIVSFNERYVLEDTIRACDELTYPNKLTILADDSSDPELVEKLRRLAMSRGCEKVINHELYQEIIQPNSSPQREPIEIWESPGFVFFHRPLNVGFKGGSLEKVRQYLASRNIEYMYLLDADWHPQKDALERTIEVLEADERTAFVQTKRISSPSGMNLFQKYISLIEEGCYYIDFIGRQVLGHPILFSGCCTLFRLGAVDIVGGFTPGHLTEDLDLTNRLWLKGWKGVYAGDVINYGEVPFSYDHFRRQQERWAAGSSRAFREYLWPVLKTNQFNWLNKLSAVRQNAYFTTTLMTGMAILLGMTTVWWIAFAWNSYAVECYLLLVGTFKFPLFALLYLCILSNFFEPLIMILFKKRNHHDLIYLPMMVWYAWSVLPTYVIGNLKGLFGVQLDWFRTPKYVRGSVGPLSRMPLPIRVLNLCVCISLLCFYFSQGWFFG
ncbi:MAG: glycosyltransferase [Deltaproteobacteria bacterium]|nr:glycosyltransferase [Deltaproteobacteria bacterium]